MVDGGNGLSETSQSSWHPYVGSKQWSSMNKTHHTPYWWKSDSWASYWNDSCAICMGLLHFKTLLTVTKILILYRLFHDVRAKFGQNKTQYGVRQTPQSSWKQDYVEVWKSDLRYKKCFIRHHDESQIAGFVLNHFMSHVHGMSPAVPDFSPYQYFPKFIAMELKPDLVFIAQDYG